MTTDDLLEKLNRIRMRAGKDSSLYKILNVPPPSSIAPSIIIGHSYAEFLGLANGARFGAVDLWSAEMLYSNQYRVEWISADDAVEIGQVSYVPLVSLLRGGIFLLEDEQLVKLSDSFWDFMGEYIFGSGYSDLTGMVDEWALTRDSIIGLL